MFTVAIDLFQENFMISWTQNSTFLLLPACSWKAENLSDFFPSIRLNDTLTEFVCSVFIKQNSLIKQMVGGLQSLIWSAK